LKLGFKQVKSSRIWILRNKYTHLYVKSNNENTANLRKHSDNYSIKSRYLPTCPTCLSSSSSASKSSVIASQQDRQANAWRSKVSTARVAFCGQWWSGPDA